MSTESNLESTTRKSRRRLLIKKKKRKLPSYSQQASKPRRKVIITRRRLLPNMSTIQVAIPTTVTTEPSEIEDIDLERSQLTNNSSEETSDENKIDLPNTTTEALNDEGKKLNTVLPIDNFSEENLTVLPLEAISEENKIEDLSDVTAEPLPENKTLQHVPDYEPFFPELSESLDVPVLILKTTVLSSIELVTKTVVQSRLRTYTFVVTRVNGDEQVVTSTTEVKPQIKTVILTEPLTKLTTLTLLDFDATSTLNPIPMTPFPSEEFPQVNTKDGQGRAFDEARYNLATRVMSNGVEVIVAGDKSTLPGEPDVKRILPSTIYKPVTLKPSTLSEHMMMLLPQDASNNLQSLYPNQFVTKTCLTTFTYLTTYLESGTTTVSSHEQVVSNIATEERNTGKILPTPAMGITLTQYPNLSVGVFHTTYTYLNTILDGEQPLVVSSKHTVTNTVTAPDDYLSLLQPSEQSSALKDTNTYYSTVTLEKTLYEGDQSKVVSTNEVVTQVVITESVPPKATSVMTSYIALDIEDPDPISMNITTTDVVKTYFVTYSYFNTLLENGNTVVKTNISTSSDVVTEKLYLHPKRTSTNIKPTIKDDKKKHKLELSGENFQILATKTYHTTFTYFTTLLQEGNNESPTVISSHSNIVENIITESVDPNLLDTQYLSILRNDVKESAGTITRLATLQDGEVLEITAIASADKIIKPTKVLPIEKTKILPQNNQIEIESSTPSVIIGSTIIFLDDEPAITSKQPTPSLFTTKSGVNSILNSEIVKKTKTATTTTKARRSTKTKTKTNDIISPTKSSLQVTASKENKKKQSNKVVGVKPAAPGPVPDLLGLGSININHLSALTPVLNAMAGLIQTNLKSSRRNDSLAAKTTPKPKFETANPNQPPATDTQNRSPIYIPVGGLSDEFEIAESQNIATFHIQETVDWDGKKNLIGKTTHESPLLNGGIPISPGEVITANSDVIVGKPGRIGPRIPAIPLNQVKGDDIGMKPPPVPNKIWPKRNHEYKHIPVANLRDEKPIIHAPSKDDYVGPPPPLIRNEKYKHIPINQQVYAESQNNYGVSFGLNEVKHEMKIPNIKEEIQNIVSRETFPIYAQNQGNPINDFNIQPSVVNEPLVLPEIIERSTGQPLLVNIQPSQVAFVNIPHNRTTALIYGGSNEPHRNGQYFDDPSPYPEPEFSGIESFNNGIPQFASVYHDSPPSQQQVGGVIKVGTQIRPIVVEPNRNNENKLLINPSRPTVVNYQNHEVSVNVPPISFGMVQQGNDFDAHIINHGDIQFNPPPISYEIVKNPDDQFVENSAYSQSLPDLKPSNHDNFKSTEEIVDLKPPSDQHFTKRPLNTNKPFSSSSKSSFSPKRNIMRQRPKPNVAISEFMTPPPFIPNNRHTTKPQFGVRPTNPRPQKPLTIPLIAENDQGISFYNPPNSVQFNMQTTMQNNIPVRMESNIPNYPNPDLDLEEDDADDLTSEDGEVIQESNSRPLRPGQIPHKILKTRTSTTEKPSNTTNHVRFPDEKIKFPHYDNEIHHYPRPVVFHPRPFLVKSDNQQTNQVNNFDNHTIHTNKEPSNQNDEQQQYVSFITSLNPPNQLDHSFIENPNIHNVEIITENTGQFVQDLSKPVMVSNFKNQQQPTSKISHQNDEIKTKTEPQWVNYHINPHLGEENKAQWEKNANQHIKPQHQATTPQWTNGQSVKHIPQHWEESATRKSIFENRNNVTTNQIFGVKTRPQISIHETTSTEKSFTVRPNRPKVTSLPIDPQIITVEKATFNSQTEKPFRIRPKPSFTINELLNREKVTTQSSIMITKLSKVENDSVSLESNMEIMKPPPLVPVRTPEVNMQPPKVNNISSTSNLKVPSSTVQPFIVQPSDTITKSDAPIRTEEVLGMNPPPLITTYKPDNLNTKPVFSMEIDPPSTTHHPRTRRPTSKRPSFYRPSASSTRKPSTNHAFTRKPQHTYQFTRRPQVNEEINRKPQLNYDTTKKPPTIYDTTREPQFNYGTSKEPQKNNEESGSVQNNYEVAAAPPQTVSKIDEKQENQDASNRNKTTTTLVDDIENTTKETTFNKNVGANAASINSSSITPSPTVGNVPSLEVIIGSPNPIEVPLSKQVKISGSELETSTTTTLKTPIVTSTFKDTNIGIITTAVHHAGNEVKVVDDSSSIRKLIPTTFKENTPVLPTRFITHTKTSTVTITKTTVVKSLGSPPSTLTLLVTKTEKSTIVDTVTEFHTLVKPTSIVETVTTTIGSSLYPSDVHGSTYPSIKIRPTSTTSSEISSSTLAVDEDDDDLDDFIIHETDRPIVEEQPAGENESIFVVMTDKKKGGSIIKMPNNSYETQARDEMLANNEVNNVLLGGILIAHPPVAEVPKVVKTDKCDPECKASRNELCQKVDGAMRCICRPGFARMFPDRPCIPTYTYGIKVDLDRHGRERLAFNNNLSNANTTEFSKLASAVHDALDRMLMQSDLRDIYHGVHVHSFVPSTAGVATKFYLQLSDNTDESRLEDVFKKYLRNNNYSLGGTEVFAAKDTLLKLKAEDFDECKNNKYHDCSENAQCFNLKGTYTCSCKEGFTDMSENILYPGRICSAELIGCETCNYHGTCFSRGEGQMFCECFRWYTGDYCHINLKVLLIALVALGILLFALLIICIIFTCCRRKPRQSKLATGMSFLPQRVTNAGNRSTLDRRAMIQDTSSEDSRSETNTLPYVAKPPPPPPQKKKSALKKKSSVEVDNGETTISFPDQKDRSLTVMIPRAKYHPAPPTSPLINYTSFDARKPSVPTIGNEAKLLSYLDAGPSPSKSDNKRKYSAQSASYIEEKPGSRKTSGALVSAGFEVSATVLANTIGTTTCGTEADRSENATLIQKISADLLSSSTGTRSQFNTLRKSMVDDDIDPVVNWMDITPRITTVSEARSYDETTIPPPVKSFRNDYDSKANSQHQNDEANTMAERDLGSTFLLPHTHLYKPDRGSDISGFESL